jgi:hypothetical protein
VHTKSGVKLGKTNDRPSWWHFSSFDQTTAYNPAIEAHGPGTVVHVLNFSPNGGSTPPISADACTKIQLINGSLGSLRVANSWAKDEGGTLEAWRYRTLGGDVVKSAVTRTGGAAYSAKMTFDQDANERRPLMFSQAGRETVYAYLPIGTRTITCFLATKAYAVPMTGDDFWFEIEYYDVGGTTHRAVASSRGSAVTADGSTWTGDSGLTVLKSQAILINTKASLVQIRFFLRRYDASGITYVDPRCRVS